jgi:hypothetical protein
MGLEFRAASIFTRVLANSSSEACNRPNSFLRHLFVMPTILSHHPPYQAALGATNFHLIPYWATKGRDLSAERAPTAQQALYSPCGMFVHCQCRWYAAVRVAQ